MGQHQHVTVRYIRDPNRFASLAAARIAAWIDSTLATHPICTLVLAGGRTPRPVYRALAVRYATRIPWHRVHIFWGDERCVPPHHPDSNYRMARETLLDSLSVPEENVHRIPAECVSPEDAAMQYEQTLRTFFQAFVPSSENDLFDVTILGVGTDGHTASLFPYHPAARETRRWVCATEAVPEVTPRWRIMLTVPRLHRSRQVIFLVSGREKQSIVSTILRAPDPWVLPYPAAWIRGVNETVWYVHI